jgi:hypothetical protein
MVFNDEMQTRFPQLYPIARAGAPTAEQIPAPTAAQAEVPEGIRQLAEGVQKFMPMIEQVTGLDRKTIFMQLLKTGSRGGGLVELINGLSGNRPAPEAKFVKMLKTGAIWIPVGIFLAGLSVVGVVVFAKILLMVINS